MESDFKEERGGSTLVEVGGGVVENKIFIEDQKNINNFLNTDKSSASNLF